MSESTRQQLQEGEEGQSQEGLEREERRRERDAPGRDDDGLAHREDHVLVVAVLAVPHLDAEPVRDADDRLRRAVERRGPNVVVVGHPADARVVELLPGLDSR